jgi:hypothetical protein
VRKGKENSAVFTINTAWPWVDNLCLKISLASDLVDCWQGVQVAGGIKRYWTYWRYVVRLFCCWMWCWGFWDPGVNTRWRALSPPTQARTHKHTHTFVLFNKLVEFYDHYKGQTNSLAFPFLSDLLTAFLTRVFFFFKLRSILHPALNSLDSVASQEFLQHWEESHKIKHVTEEYCSLGWMNELLFSAIRFFYRK